MTSLKPIAYRGGIVRFEIPSDWIEEYEPSGGGTFYENRPDSGTLRLNVLSFSSKDTPAEEMARSVFKDKTTDVLPSGFLMRHYIKAAEEKGEGLEIYRWEVAVPIEPFSLRLVMFAHTIVEGQQSDPRIAAELKMIAHSVLKAEFSQEEGVGGDYDHSGSST